jgi:acyl-CoA thioesterase I
VLDRRDYSLKGQWASVFKSRWASVIIIVASYAACAALLVSCGSHEKAPSPEQRNPTSSGSQIAPAPSPAPAPNQDERPVIVTFGDSLTAGVAGRSYPDNLQDLLDENGFRFRVDNQGVSGDTSSDGLARIENVIAEHPALVLLEFGGNDGLRGIPIAATRKNLQEMIERLLTAKIPVVILGITLPPNYGSDYVKPFTAMFPDLAKQYHLKYMPFLLLNVYRSRDLMQPDGIHPNGEGNKIVARDVFQLIRPMLTAAQKSAHPSREKL